MTLAEQIKILCVRRGISVAELARRIGQSPQNFSSKLKRKKLSVQDMEDIAKAVECTYEYCFILPDGDRIS